MTLFSSSDVTAFHRMKYRGGGVIKTFFSPSDVTAFHGIGLFPGLECGCRTKKIM